MLTRQIFLQLGSRCLLDSAQEEIGLSVNCLDAIYLIQQGTQALSLGQIGLQV